MTVLVDSDILIEVTRARNLEILRLWEQLSESPHVILYSPVSAAELWQGARIQEHKILTNLFDSLRCAPVDGETGHKVGQFLSQYRKSHNLELGDALIAASATLNAAELWTRNRKHYPMISAFFAGL